MRSMSDRPAAPVLPAAVIDAFGLRGAAVPLPGGEGRCVRVGAAVLKPVEDSPETTWVSELLSSVEERGFRLARPMRARDGRWVVAGWSASRFVEGEAGPSGRWAELVSAARALHAALRSAPEPAFLAGRTHRWAVADRVAWGEARVEPHPEVAPLLYRLEAALRPVTSPCQLVHGDLSGNVLFADAQLPAIIDFSPYWRPASYADAIVAVDGLLWFDAGRDVLELAWSSQDFPQMLLRALIFRLVAFNEAARGAADEVLDELTRFRTVVSCVVTPAGG